MAEFTVAKIDDIEGIYGGAFKRARAALGVSSFGCQVVDMPPNADQYPEHDHSADGQEEVYVTLRGTGEIDIEGDRFPLDSDHLVSVKAGTKRKVFAGPEGVRVLVIGGVPGKVYEAGPMTELGGPESF